MIKKINPSLILLWMSSVFVAQVHGECDEQNPLKSLQLVQHGMGMQYHLKNEECAKEIENALLDIKKIYAEKLPQYHQWIQDMLSKLNFFSDEWPSVIDEIKQKKSKVSNVDNVLLTNLKEKINKIFQKYLNSGIAVPLIRTPSTDQKAEIRELKDLITTTDYVEDLEAAQRFWTQARQPSTSIYDTCKHLGYLLQIRRGCHISSKDINFWNQCKQYAAELESAIEQKYQDLLLYVENGLTGRSPEDALRSTLFTLPRLNFQNLALSMPVIANTLHHLYNKWNTALSTRFEQSAKWRSTLGKRIDWATKAVTSLPDGHGKIDLLSKILEELHEESYPPEDVFNLKDECQTGILDRYKEMRKSRGFSLSDHISVMQSVETLYNKNLIEKDLIETLKQLFLSN